MGKGTQFPPPNKRKDREMASEAIYVYKLGDKTAVNQDGTVGLVNDGTAGGRFSMHTGQGFAFDGTQSVNDVMQVLPPEFSLVLQVQSVGTTNNILFAQDYLNSVYINATGGVVKGWVGGSELTAEFEVDTYLKSKLIIDTYKNGVYTRFVNGSVIASIECSIKTSMLSFMIGGSEQVNAKFIGTSQGVAVIPKSLTPLQTVQAYQKPHLLLYKKNGTLQSGVLDRATLEQMEAGKGCWYPMTEGQGTVIHNNALRIPELAQIVNVRNSAGWVNAKGLKEGLQQSLTVTDNLGISSDLISEKLSFNGNGYISLENLILNDTWCIDIYTNLTSGVILDLKCTDLNDVLTGYVQVYNEGIGLKVRSNTQFSTMAGVDEAVLSIEAINGMTSLYLNGTIHRVFSNTLIKVSGGSLGRRSNGTSFAQGQVFAQITATTRTVAERDIQVTKLIKKYKVVA